ncbi:MAG: metal-sulfur cluster assembly factor [Candidatus Levybacteria bacterium]|nr:metal-sulfur cluster assembly factor [Candidatus Levybacteria bacterium]
MITKDKILRKLKMVIDPELNVNIVDMGLIYDVDIDQKKGAVDIKMTLTTPGCPLSAVFDEWVRDAVKSIKGVKRVTIDLVWEPAWTPDRMTDEVKEAAGMI